MGARSGGPARVGRRSPTPSKIKKVFGLYWGPFCYFFFIRGPFCYVFLIFGGLFTMWGHFCYFILHGGGIFLSLPPPPYEDAGAHDCKVGSRVFCLSGCTVLSAAFPVVQCFVCCLSGCTVSFCAVFVFYVVVGYVYYVNNDSLVFCWFS